MGIIEQLMQAFQQPQAKALPSAATADYARGAGVSSLPGTTLGAPQGPTGASMANLMTQAAPETPAAPPMPAPKPLMAPATTEGWQANVAPAKPGISGNDVRTFLRSLSAGAANNTPGSKIGGFFKGMSGALEGREAIKRQAESERAKAEETKFERGLKTSQEKRARAKAKREEREGRIRSAKVVSEVMKNLSPTISVADRANVLTALTKFAEMKSTTEGLSGQELKDAVETERKRIMGESSATNPQTGERLILRNGEWQPLQQPSQ